jgi:hypothetical protein
VNPSELPDETIVYVPDYGETTVGALRSPLAALDGAEDATVRMWVYICCHAPGASPWKTGRIRVGGKAYPASVFMSDRFLPLSTSNGTPSADAGSARSRTQRADASRNGGSP